MKKNNRKGFTIVELVIVIAVIAILAAVLIPTFSNMIDKANKSADLQEARNAYSEYVAENAEDGIDEKVAIKVGDKYFKFDGGKINEEPEDSAPADYTIVCDEHTWDAGTGECSVCGEDCPETHAADTTCDTCGKVTAAAP